MAALRSGATGRIDASPVMSTILKGEKTANMPVRAPTRHQLVINLNIAKTLGFDIPVNLRQVNEVIEWT
jgi:ABC-type uncharacterized transport system substrate-binding protein